MIANFFIKPSTILKNNDHAKIIRNMGFKNSEVISKVPFSFSEGVYQVKKKRNFLRDIKTSKIYSRAIQMSHLGQNPDLFLMENLPYQEQYIKIDSREGVLEREYYILDELSKLKENKYVSSLIPRVSNSYFDSKNNLRGFGVYSVENQNSYAHTGNKFGLFNQNIPIIEHISDLKSNGRVPYSNRCVDQKLLRLISIQMGLNEVRENSSLSKYEDFEHFSTPCDVKHRIKHFIEYDNHFKSGYLSIFFNSISLYRDLFNDYKNDMSNSNFYCHGDPQDSNFFSGEYDQAILGDFGRWGIGLPSIDLGRMVIPTNSNYCVENLVSLYLETYSNCFNSRSYSTLNLENISEKDLIEKTYRESFLHYMGFTSAMMMKSNSLEKIAFFKSQENKLEKLLENPYFKI